MSFGRVISIWTLSSEGHYGLISASPPMKNTTTRDQFKLIRIRENLVASYDKQLDCELKISNA